MEKIILTVEQGEVIKNMPGRHWRNDEVIEHHAKYKWTDKRNEALNDLSISQLARILYEPNSYEVEKPKFEVGDWVVFEKSNTIKRVETIIGQGISGCLNGGCVMAHRDNFRHATKEEIFWAELGREVGEFVEGDVLLTKFDGTIEVVDDAKIVSKNTCYLNDTLIWSQEGSIKGFYPANAFIKFPVGNDS
jgi:hypothetical protein